MNGTWDVKGVSVDGKPGKIERVKPADITTSALLTVEGELDDISGSGQTEAAHKLCSGIAKASRQHFEAKGAGHYGIFSGRRWREQVYPEVKAFILAHHTAQTAPAPAKPAKPAIPARPAIPTTPAKTVKALAASVATTPVKAEVKAAAPVAAPKAAVKPAATVVKAANAKVATAVTITKAAPKPAIKTVSKAVIKPVTAAKTVVAKPASLPLSKVKTAWVTPVKK